MDTNEQSCGRKPSGRQGPTRGWGTAPGQGRRADGKLPRSGATSVRSDERPRSGATCGGRKPKDGSVASEVAHAEGEGSRPGLVDALQVGHHDQVAELAV